MGNLSSTPLTSSDEQTTGQSPTLPLQPASEAVSSPSARRSSDEQTTGQSPTLPLQPASEAVSSPSARRSSDEQTTGQSPTLPLQPASEAVSSHSARRSSDEQTRGQSPPVSETVSSHSEPTQSLFGEDMHLEFPDRVYESARPLIDPLRGLYEALDALTVGDSHPSDAQVADFTEGQDPDSFSGLLVNVLLDSVQFLNRISSVPLVEDNEITSVFIDHIAPESSLSGKKTTEVCCICLSDMKEAEIVRKLPCKHIIHKECVDTWFKTTTRCPMCRSDVLDSRMPV